MAKFLVASAIYSSTVGTPGMTGLMRYASAAAFSASASAYKSAAASSLAYLAAAAAFSSSSYAALKSALS